MSWLCGVVVSVALSVTGAAVDLTSPAVFNAIFYITANVEVWHAGARNVTSAKYHWLHHGIDEGLQACGSFHSAQYIRRYSDVEKAHGLHGYRQAIEHYLTTGQHEHRVGYLEGGYGGRWTVSDAHHKLFVSASARMGAAIDSLVWNNHEFINSIDHGRELQMAFNILPYGGCFNPTEAGGRYDGLSTQTNSKIQSVHASGITLSTTVWPAFWFRAVNYIGEKPCPGGMNTENTYRHPFSKKVTLECPGISQSCLHFRSTFTIAGVFPHYTMLQMVAPAGYLTGDFTVWRSYDYSSGHLVAYHTKMPVVLSSPDKHFAMGVFASPKQDTDEDMYYGRFVLSKDKITADTNKWNVVFRKHTLPAGTTHVFNYDTYICVGTLNDVTACLKKLTQAHHADLVG
ncbi:uncharacterized protein [Littorina saxatilis]|uniref:uncharacterized protein isoform X2 n=1 Tax=Littorina saxatilis TaxID=31220 RepID=UPI0038B42A8A